MVKALSSNPSTAKRHTPASKGSTTSNQTPSWGGAFGMVFYFLKALFSFSNCKNFLFILNLFYIYVMILNQSCAGGLRHMTQTIPLSKYKLIGHP
jgi:hypothetical protein